MIPKDHKCLHCVWAQYVGTGFFCPWPEGYCVKEDSNERGDQL